MANICYSTYQIRGNQSELTALHDLMMKCKTEKQNPRWVGHLVEALNDGKIPDNLYVRGWWHDPDLEEGYLEFNQESAWEPLYEAWDFIASKFKSLKVYFSGEEEGFEVFLKRDTPDGRFPDNYYVDICTPDEEYIHEYFIDLGDALDFLSRVTERKINGFEDIYELDAEWREQANDLAYINLHEYTEV